MAPVPPPAGPPGPPGAAVPAMPPGVARCTAEGSAAGSAGIAAARAARRDREPARPPSPPPESPTTGTPPGSGRPPPDGLVRHSGAARRDDRGDDDRRGLAGERAPCSTPACAAGPSAAAPRRPGGAAGRTAAAGRTRRGERPARAALPRGRAPASRVPWRRSRDACTACRCAGGSTGGGARGRASAAVGDALHRGAHALAALAGVDLVVLVAQAAARPEQHALDRAARQAHAACDAVVGEALELAQDQDLVLRERQVVECHAQRLELLALRDRGVGAGRACERRPSSLRAEVVGVDRDLLRALRAAQVVDARVLGDLVDPGPERDLRSVRRRERRADMKVSWTMSSALPWSEHDAAHVADDPVPGTGGRGPRRPRPARRGSLQRAARPAPLWPLLPSVASPRSLPPIATGPGRGLPAPPITLYPGKRLVRTSHDSQCRSVVQTHLTRPSDAV